VAFYLKLADSSLNSFIFAVRMRQTLIIILLLLSTLAGCDKDDTSSVSGTVTLESTLYGSGPYYAYGFLFSGAEKVTTLSDPGPDITVFVWKNLDGTIKEISFETSNYYNSFSLIGEYGNEAAAMQVFNDLTTVGSVQWTQQAIPLKNNQVWLYRSDDVKYAKLRLVSLVEKSIQEQPVAECTFEWVYQPDGTTTFPPK